MATTVVMNQPIRDVILATWSSVNANQNGDAAQMPQYTGKVHVAVTGTFDTETVTIQGSLDGSNYFALEDEDGNAAALTAAGLITLRSNPLYIRPSVSNGGGAPDVKVIVMAAAPS